MEIELPKLPERIAVPLEKLPKLLEILEEKEGALASQVNHKFVVQLEYFKEKAWSPSAPPDLN